MCARLGCTLPLSAMCSLGKVSHFISGKTSTLHAFSSAMGCNSGKSLEAAPKMETFGNIIKDFPVRLPALPGDVLISGNLPTELVD